MATLNTQWAAGNLSPAVGAADHTSYDIIDISGPNNPKTDTITIYLSSTYNFGMTAGGR